MDGALLLILLTNVVGLAVSVDLSLSLVRFWSILLGIFLFYGLFNGLGTERACRVVGNWAVAAGLGLALLALLGTDWGSVRLLDLPFYRLIPELVRDPLDSDLFNPRVMGMALAVLLPLPLTISLAGDGLARRAFSAAVAVVMGLILLLTQSVQAIPALLAALLVLLAWRDSRLLLVFLPVAALGLVALFAYGPQRLLPPLLSVDHPLGVAVVLRLDMWNRALAMLRDMPYTGVGLNVYPIIQVEFYPGLLLGSVPHAHNLYLQIALDLGLPGLFAFLWLLVGFARIVVGAARCGQNRALGAVLAGEVAGVAAYLGAGLVDAPWATKPGVLFWLLLGMATATARLIQGKSRPAPRGWQWGPLLGLGVAVLLGLLLLPGSASLNLGSIEAHRLLLQAEAGDAPPAGALARTASHLERAAQWRPDDSQLYRTLGRLYGWLGEDDLALDVLERSVELDGEDAMGAYAPWVVWARRLQGEEGPDRWEDLVGIYGLWMVRYPQRAESYIQIALVWERHLGDSARARAVLESGLENGAQPRELVSYYVSLLE